MAFVFSSRAPRYHSTLMLTESKKNSISKNARPVIHSHVSAVDEREKNHMSRRFTINLSIIKHGNLLFMKVGSYFAAVGFMSLPFSRAISSSEEPSLRFIIKNIHDNPTNYYCPNLSAEKHTSFEESVGGRGWRRQKSTKHSHVWLKIIK